MSRPRFLIDENLPRADAAVLARHYYEAIDVRDAGLRGQPDSAVADYALRHRLAIITRDFDFGDPRIYPPAMYHGVAILDLPDDAVAARVVLLLDVFVQQEAIVSQLAGRLVIVEFGRVRVRPPLE